MWNANFSKSYYLRQVHQPRHLPEPARLFGSDFLEIFTRTKWFVVPLIWLPIAVNLFVRSVVNFARPLPPFVQAPLLPFTAPYLQSVTPHGLSLTVASFLLGNIVWTILEYTLHRFLFHIDDLLPDKPAFLTLHFLLHGIHHYLPMDRYV